jgi:hypothetical protein
MRDKELTRFAYIGNQFICEAKTNEELKILFLLVYEIFCNGNYFSSADENWNSITDFYCCYSTISLVAKCRKTYKTHTCIV